MTRIEAETAGGLDGERRADATRSQVVISVLTAILVLALGLLLVGVTSDGAAERPPAGTAVGSPLR